MFSYCVAVVSRNSGQVKVCTYPFPFYLFLFSIQVTETESERLSAFFSRNSYVSGNYTAESAFSELNAHILSLPGASDANRLFYLALPPTIYHSVTKNIKRCCMSAKSVDRLLLLSEVHNTQWLLFF